MTLTSYSDNNMMMTGMDGSNTRPEYLEQDFSGPAAFNTSSMFQGHDCSVASYTDAASVIQGSSPCVEDGAMHTDSGFSFTDGNFSDAVYSSQNHQLTSLAPEDASVFALDFQALKSEQHQQQTTPISEECSQNANTLMVYQSSTSGLEQNTPLSPMSFCASPAPGPVLIGSISAGASGYHTLIPCTPISPSSSSRTSTTVSTTYQQNYSSSREMAGAETSCFDFLEYPLDNSGQQQQQPNPAVVASQGNPGTPKPVVSLEHTTVKQQQKQQPHSLGTSEQSRNPEKVQPNAVQSDTAAWKETSVEQQRSTLSNSELRRQIHIQSEQKRRAQIKDGFEDLRNELPSCLNKKMSKVALLHRTVQHIQHLKNTQATILAELERLVSENEQLRKFQEQVLQKQALAKMYPVNSL